MIKRQSFKLLLRSVSTILSSCASISVTKALVLFQFRLDRDVILIGLWHNILYKTFRNLYFYRKCEDRNLLSQYSSPTHQPPIDQPPSERTHRTSNFTSKYVVFVRWFLSARFLYIFLINIKVKCTLYHLTEYYSV